MTQDFKGTAGDWGYVKPPNSIVERRGYKYYEISSKDSVTWIAEVIGQSDEQAEANAKLMAASKKMLEALVKISNWELPETGKFWDREKTDPMSYQAAYGSLGVEDYFRQLAQEALKAAL